MSLPSKKIKKIKLPGDVEGSQTYEIIPEKLGKNGYAAELPTLTEDSTILLGAISITYAQLKVLIDNSQLVAGSFYRIIDFVTTTAQARTQSAGHQFDLIVHAISANELSEDANAVLHSGDTYFANSNLKAWVLKYSFANDTSKYAWADAVNGKGVIYYMKDEYQNECPYDFKNIQFARYKITACANCTGLVGQYCGARHHTSGDTVLSSYMTIDTSDYKYFYTFDLCQTDHSLNPIGKTFTRPNGTTFTPNQIQCTKCEICADENDSPKYYLNNFVCMLEASRDCMFKIKGWCQNVTFLGGCSNVEISNIYGSLVGAYPTSGFIDGYVANSSTITLISDSLICSSGSQYAIYSSIIDGIQNSLLTSKNKCINYATINYIYGSTLICTSSSSMVVRQSTIGYIANCTITCSTCAFYLARIEGVSGCTGSGATYYCYAATGNMLTNITMYDTDINASFISETTFNYISNTTLTRLLFSKVNDIGRSSLRNVRGCTIVYSRYLTCAQDLQSCTFDANASYLNISSTDTTQTITSTHFNNIRGTDADNIKSVVIPEDYSTEHTVELYGPGGSHVHEIA